MKGGADVLCQGNTAPDMAVSIVGTCSFFVVVLKGEEALKEEESCIVKVSLSVGYQVLKLSKNTLNSEIMKLMRQLQWTYCQSKHLYPWLQSENSLFASLFSYQGALSDV